jgi:anti-sigma regulatory factor (Ser/Thr protein kinase)
MPLLIDDTAREQIKALKEYAEKNQYTMDDLLDIKNGAQEAPGNNAFYSCALPVGYKVVYTIEQQVPGTLRHMSISVNGKVPPIEAVQMIMAEFSFENELKDCYLYLEEGGVAINVIEPYNG